MKITQETISKLNELGYNVLGRKGYKTTNDGLPYKQAENLVVVLETNNDFIIKDFKTPKEKEVTVEGYFRRLTRNRTIKIYHSICAEFLNTRFLFIPLRMELGLTFGRHHKEIADKIADKLKELGVKYRNEFSDAAWVYRFIISKDSENMKIIESLKCA